MSITDIPDRELYMKYIGLLALLGRTAKHSILSPDDMDCVDRAFEDANTLLKARGREIKFVKASAGGWTPVGFGGGRDEDQADDQSDGAQRAGQRGHRAARGGGDPGA